MTEYKRGLFACMDDTSLCINVWCCANCVYGKIQETALQASCIVCCACGGILHPCQRQALNEKYGIQEPCINSYLIAMCCGSCAICQEAHEVEEREGGKFGFGGCDFVKAAGAPAGEEISR